MCYRYLLKHLAIAGCYVELADAAAAAGSEWQPRYNVALTSRMPVMLGPNSGPAWLGNHPLDPAQLDRLCRPLPAGMMNGHRVDPRVNHVRYESPDCIVAI